MRTQNSLQTETFEHYIMLQMLNDVSHLATLWFFSDGLNLPEGKEIILTTNYPGHFDISETGLEDHAARRAASVWQEAISYKPKTPLGRKLWAIRARIVASGEPLFSWEEIEQEIASQRGETE